MKQNVSTGQLIGMVALTLLVVGGLFFMMYTKSQYPAPPPIPMGSGGISKDNPTPVTLPQSGQSSASGNNLGSGMALPGSGSPAGGMRAPAPP